MHYKIWGSHDWADVYVTLLESVTPQSLHLLQIQVASLVKKPTSTHIDLSLFSKNYISQKNEVYANNFIIVCEATDIFIPLTQKKSVDVIKYRAIEKLHNSFLTRVLFVKKYTEIRKKQCYIECWKRPPRSATHACVPFLLFNASRWGVAVSLKRSIRRDTVDLSGTGESIVPLNSLSLVK
jgi:hypothetical protein